MAVVPESGVFRENLFERNSVLPGIPNRDMGQIYTEGSTAGENAYCGR